MSFSTAGATPWTFLLGQLDTGSGAPALSSGAPSVAALALSLAPHKRDVGRTEAARSRGRARNGTDEHRDLDSGESEPSHLGGQRCRRSLHRADRMGAPRVCRRVGTWAGTELETSVLRGAPSHGMAGPAIVGTLDREVARGRLQPLPGFTIRVSPVGRARRRLPTRRTRGSARSASRTERAPYGNLTATRQTEFTSQQAQEIRRVEWRQAAAGGLTLRYTETPTTRPDATATDSASKLVELDLPRLTRAVSRRTPEPSRRADGESLLRDAGDWVQS